jgi:hypothetical protein
VGSILLQLVNESQLLNLVEQAQIPKVLVGDLWRLRQVLRYQVEHVASRFPSGAKIFFDSAGDVIAEISVHSRVGILEVLGEGFKALFLFLSMNCMPSR